MHIFQPTAVRERVTEITPQFLQSLGVRALLLDVDNTLATYTSHAPSPGALEWVKAMGEAGFRMIIISNNFKGRVGSFGAVFGLDTLSFALKPLPVGYLRAAKRLRVKPQECVIIGDQIFTDIVGANLCGMKSVLLSPIEPEAALVFSEKNRRYFTQFPATDGALLVTAEEAYLLMDFRYEEAARYKAQYCTVVGFDSLMGKLQELLQKHGVQEVYMECEQLSVAQARRFEEAFQKVGVQAVLDSTLDNAIRDQRMIKSPEEVKKIEASQEITDAAFQHILPYIKEGVTERDLALEIEFFMRKQGAENVAFELIVAAGKNGSQCHAVPSDNQVHKGDFITMDTGALLDGYHSDMTRTVALGQVSDEQKAVYDTVLKAHLAVIDYVKPGVVCSDVDKVARDIIEKDYPGTFGHGLGHGVGFEIHEWPRFGRGDSTLAAEGMVVTDEPGIYLPAKYGVRIEDMLLVTADGCRSLTKSPKELICL